MTKKKKIFFIKSRLPPSLCFPSGAVFPAGWRKDMRVPGVLHRALHNEASVENKMPQTRIILIKSWNQPCVKIQGKVSGEPWRNEEWAWELQGRTWGHVSKGVWGEIGVFPWLAWSLSIPKAHFPRFMVVFLEGFAVTWNTLSGGGTSISHMWNKFDKHRGFGPGTWQANICYVLAANWTPKLGKCWLLKPIYCKNCDVQRVSLW